MMKRRIIAVFLMIASLAFCPKAIGDGDKPIDELQVYKNIYEDLERLGLMDAFFYDHAAVNAIVDRYLGDKHVSAGLALEWCFHRFEDQYGQGPSTQAIFSASSAVNVLFWHWLGTERRIIPDAQTVAESRMVTSTAVRVLQKTNEYQDFSSLSMCMQLIGTSVGEAI